VFWFSIFNLHFSLKETLNILIGAV
jgi:hypothetical protein